MGWADGVLLGGDTETTSVDPETARLVTATWAVCPPNGDPEVTEWLADPGVEIPAEATEKHGVTTEQARADGRREGEVVADMLEWLAGNWTPDRALVVFNASYDLTLLDRRGRAHGLLGEQGLSIRGPVIDPLVCDRTVDRWRKAGKGGRTLLKLAAHYGVELSEQDAHMSLADTLAAVGVVRAVGRVFPELGQMDLRQLYTWQRRAQREWAPDMQAFLRRKAAEDGEPPEVVKAIVLSPHWPIEPRVPAGVQG